MILGVNSSHDSSFCLLDNRGHPVYVLEEERFNRIKHTGFTTTLSLEWVIRERLLDPLQVTDIVYSFEMEPEKTRNLMQRCYDNVIEQFGPTVFSEISQYFHQPEHFFSPTLGFGLSTDFDSVREKLRRLFPNARETSYMHHLCHAASAFYPSPFPSAAILVVDGAGRLETTTLWKGDANGLELIRQIELPNSLGLLYWLFSSYICLEEGQTMGLASYGQPIYADLINERVLDVQRDGSFRLKAPIIAWFDMSSDYAMHGIETIFGHKARLCDNEPLTQFHADVAASIQWVTEDILLRLAQDLRERTGKEHLCLAGGVIQNCVANGRLVKSKLFSDTWIQPMANDSGTALGAALVHYYEKKPTKRTQRWRMVSPQLGVGYQTEQTEVLLKQLGIPYDRTYAPHAVAARWIGEGRVVGWFQGRAEVGPRALGGRSLLADPTRPFSYFRANEIKQRQPWRPLAPSILNTATAQFIETDVDSPYMILSFSILPDARTSIPAVCHIDGSTRPQTVSRDSNNLYFELISAVYEQIGVPLVLNTSFNLGGEPLVQHPLEAIRDFLLSGIDGVILDQFIIDKKPPIPNKVKEALRKIRFIGPYLFQLYKIDSVLVLEHSQYTPTQRRLGQHLQTLLEWFKISVRHISADVLEDVLFAQQDLVLLSLAAYLDEAVVAGLSPNGLDHLQLAVLDRHLFMTRTDSRSFLRIVACNKSDFLAKLNRRQAVIYGHVEDIEEILQVLASLEVLIVGIIPTDSETKVGASQLPILSLDSIRDRADVYFLIFTAKAASKIGMQSADWGYQPNVDTLTWDS